jgi:hypothetical protein
VAVERGVGVDADADELGRAEEGRGLDTAFHMGISANALA